MSQTKAQLIDPVDGTIVNADINASAAIAASKIADFVTGNVNNRVLTASGTANSLVGESGLLFTSDSNDHALTLTGSGQAHLQLTSTSGTDHCSIDFGDSDDNDIGEIRYTNSTNAMHFDTNATLQMTLDSSGRLLLGTTTEGEGDADDFTIAGSGNTGITIRSGTSNDGAIFFSDGTSGNAEFEGTIQYLHSSNAMTFKTNHAERIRIDSSGNVGIGTSTPPTGSFHIHLTETPELNLMSTQHAQNNNCKLNFGVGQSASVSGNTGARIEMNIPNSGGQMNGELKFSTNSGDNLQERMRIDSSGNVGIAVTPGSGQGILQINGGLRIAGSASASDTTSPYIFRTSGTDNMVFATSSSERMRVTSDGFLCIGTTDTTIFNHGSSDDTGTVLDGSGGIQVTRLNDQCGILNRTGTDGVIFSFHNDGTCVGFISVASTTTAYSTNCSDRSLKKNFEDWTEDALSLFKDLKPQKFNYTFEDDSNDKSKGYVAQDLVGSFPEAYPKNDDGKYVFNPSGMVVYLMKAIQQLEAKVAALEAA